MTDRRRGVEGRAFAATANPDSGMRWMAVAAMVAISALVLIELLKDVLHLDQNSTNGEAPKQRLCEKCMGSGKRYIYGVDLKLDRVEVCDNCDGTGWVPASD